MRVSVVKIRKVAMATALNLFNSGPAQIKSGIVRSSFLRLEPAQFD